MKTWIVYDENSPELAVENGNTQIQGIYASRADALTAAFKRIEDDKDFEYLCTDEIVHTNDDIEMYFYYRGDEDSPLWYTLNIKEMIIEESANINDYDYASDNMVIIRKEGDRYFLVATIEYIEDKYQCYLYDNGEGWGINTETLLDSKNLIHDIIPEECGNHNGGIYIIEEKPLTCFFERVDYPIGECTEEVMHRILQDGCDGNYYFKIIENGCAI